MEKQSVKLACFVVLLIIVVGMRTGEAMARECERDEDCYGRLVCSPRSILPICPSSGICGCVIGKFPPAVNTRNEPNV
ncbi:hypothetical protein Q3G72_001693 [Acer saccharum]|nr:hypothetical protein Q3G72_001693 [Acer saccharum]